MQLGDRGVEVGVGRPVRGGGDDFHAHRLRLRDRAGEDIMAEIGILIHRAERLAPSSRRSISPRSASGRSRTRTGANFSRLNGSYIDRAAVSGNMFGTPFSNCAGMLALFIGVPPSSRAMKILSWLSSLFIACTARGTWYWLSSTMYRILRPWHAAFVVGFVEGHADRVAVVDALHGGHAGKIGDRADDDFRVGDATNRIGRVRDRNRPNSRAPARTGNQFFVGFRRMIYSFPYCAVTAGLVASPV